jgi:hypothetical protein
LWGHPAVGELAGKTSEISLVEAATLRYLLFWEFRAVAPTTVGHVVERDTLWSVGVPRILGHAGFLGRCFQCERWEWRALSSIRGSENSHYAYSPVERYHGDAVLSTTSSVRPIGAVVATPAERADVYAFRTATDRVGPPIARFLEHLLGLNDLVNRRLGGIGLRIHDINARGARPRDDHPLEEGVRAGSRAHRSLPLGTSSARFVADSPLEGRGFEPSVPVRGFAFSGNRPVQPFRGGRAVSPRNLPFLVQA